MNHLFMLIIQSFYRNIGFTGTSLLNSMDILFVSVKLLSHLYSNWWNNIWKKNVFVQCSSLSFCSFLFILLKDILNQNKLIMVSKKVNDIQGQNHLKIKISLCKWTFKCLIYWPLLTVHFFRIMWIMLKIISFLLNT